MCKLFSQIKIIIQKKNLNSKKNVENQNMIGDIHEYLIRLSHFGKMQEVTLFICIVSASAFQWALESWKCYVQLALH